MSSGALGCEGMVSQRLSSPYCSGRLNHWLKIQNPAAPAVRRLEEDDWARRRALARSPTIKQASISSTVATILRMSPVGARRPNYSRVTRRGGSRPILPNRQS
jgi:hypothetical protein